MISFSSSRAVPPDPRGHPARWGAALVATMAAVMAAIAGCGSGSSHGNSPTGPLSPLRAINLAAAQRVDSLTATIGISSGGLTSPITATLSAQLKPTLLLHMTLNGVTSSGSSAQIEEILTSNALYLKDAALPKLHNKPWYEITFAQLSSRAGINFGSLLQQVENSNPENQVKLFAISKDIHVVGTGTVNGVATTEYAGTYAPSAAIARLPSGLRKLLGPVLRLMGNTPVKFHVWLDAQHVARKAIVDETLAGHSIVTTYTITSVNQPVNVTPPPSSEVAPLP